MGCQITIERYSTVFQTHRKYVIIVIQQGEADLLIGVKPIKSSHLKANLDGKIMQMQYRLVNMHAYAISFVAGRIYDCK